MKKETPAKPKLLATLGEIARRHDVPIHRVHYIIRTRGIEPCGRAGNVRVFDEDAVDRIAHEIRDQDERRSGG